MRKGGVLLLFSCARSAAAAGLVPEPSPVIDASSSFDAGLLLHGHSHHHQRKHRQKHEAEKAREDEHREAEHREKEHKERAREEKAHAAAAAAAAAAPKPGEVGYGAKVLESDPYPHMRTDMICHINGNEPHLEKCSAPEAEYYSQQLRRLVFSMGPQFHLLMYGPSWMRQISEALQATATISNRTVWANNDNVRFDPGRD